MHAMRMNGPTGCPHTCEVASSSLCHFHVQDICLLQCKGVQLWQSLGQLRCTALCQLM